MRGLNKQRVARNFGRAAADYEQCAVLQKTVAERLLSRLDLVTVDPETLVDAGAGTGYAARLLARRYKRARIIQLDLSQAMLARSISRGPRFFSRHSHVCGDVENMPLASRCCQLLFSSLTYQWCNNLQAAFAEAARVLAPNGLLMFTTFGPDTLQELRYCWSTVDDRQHVNTFLDMHDIGDALVRAGLENVVMDVETLTVQYPDCHTLMHEIRHIGAGNSHADRNRNLIGKKRLQKVINAYEAFRRDGRLPATYEVVYGHAWVPVYGLQPDRGNETYVPVSSIGRRHE